MAELKNALGSGDVFAAWSRQFRDFDAYLMPRTEFNLRKTARMLLLSASISSESYVEGRLSALRGPLDQTEALATAGELPDVELTGAGLKINPLENSVPKSAEASGIRSTSLCRTKDHGPAHGAGPMDGLHLHFAHFKSEEPVKISRSCSQICCATQQISAWGKMAESCPGTSLARLTFAGCLIHSGRDQPSPGLSIINPKCC